MEQWGSVTCKVPNQRQDLNGPPLGLNTVKKKKMGAKGQVSRPKNSPDKGQAPKEEGIT